MKPYLTFTRYKQTLVYKAPTSYWTTCNIVLQQTQNAIEERLQRLEESLHNAHSHRILFKKLLQERLLLWPLNQPRWRETRLFGQRIGAGVKNNRRSLWVPKETWKLCFVLVRVEIFPDMVQLKHPPSIQILETRIPRFMEKPIKLVDYDGKRDPDEHVQLVDERLSYFSVDNAYKCKLFTLTLIGKSRL